MNTNYIYSTTAMHKQNLIVVTAGKSKAKVITECRNAIKTNNVNLLLKVIKSGEAS